jgi:hypothetical protein
VFLSALLDSVGALALRASRKRVDRQVTLSAIIVILLAAIANCNQLTVFFSRTKPALATSYQSTSNTFLSQ